MTALGAHAVLLQSNSIFSKQRAIWIDFPTQKSLFIWSLGETEYLVMLSLDGNYVPSESASSRLTEIKQLSSMLHSLRKTIQSLTIRLRT